MQDENEFLVTAPFELYQLFLFQRVVENRSFTRAAELSRLTQSAITRQIQRLETSLGVNLLERTTRSVAATPAGEYLLAESRRLLGDAQSLLRRFREQYCGKQPEVRLGVSETVALAYVPGFFHANLRRVPNVSCRLSTHPGPEVLSSVQAGELDLGVLCPPNRLPRDVVVTHRFRDAFTLIVPNERLESAPQPSRRRAFADWMVGQNWFLIGGETQTGMRIRKWLSGKGWLPQAVRELNSFDLIINLVALGMGISLVPTRALALYGRKRTLRRITLPERFSRELIVVTRRRRKQPEHLSRFIENILF